MQKARRHSTRLLRPLVGTWFQELFHSSIRSAFHLSFTVLFHYRSQGSIQPYGMVPADSDGISRAPPYSGYHKESTSFRLQDYHFLRFSFPANSTMIQFCNSYIMVLQPQSIDWFGLFPFRSPLLGKSIFLSFPPLTKMFQFSGLLSVQLCVH